MCERMNEKQIFLKILRILSGSHLLFVQLIADDKKRNFGVFDAQQALQLLEDRARGQRLRGCLEN